MRSLSLLGVALVGLVGGSFLNVVTYRVPRHESLAFPPSHCTNCQHRLAVWELIPVVSWLLLGGRCRNCHSPISARYPLTELGSSAMCVAIALRVGWHPDLVLYLVVGLALVALGTIDAQHLLLPRRLIYPVTAVALGWCLVTAQVTHQLHRLFVALVAGLLWWGLFGMLRLLNSKWMGGGDVRLVFLLGLVLGWYQPGSVLVAFFSANILGVVVGSLFIARGTTTRQDPLPFGTYLALGAAMGFFIQPFLATRLPIFDF